MINFYKDGSVWVLGDLCVPAGSMMKRTCSDGKIEVLRYYDYANGGFQVVACGMYSNFCDINKNTYTSEEAFKAATDGFFVDASNTEASPTSTGLMSAADKKKLDSLSAPILNNMSATAAPTATDDTTKGYGASSTWVYSGTTYTCTDATAGKAVWVSSTNMYYFDTWAQLVAVISVSGSTYVGKHCSVANANGAPSSGLTYVAPTPVDSIVDGGEAVLLVNAQGTNYSVTCQPRTVKNPVITSVMLTAANKPTVKGYYIFTVTPTNGLPAGISLNDIAYFDGTVWSVYQKYTKADTVLVANTSSGVEVTWRKFNGTWMSTADEYIPNGNEYQTGKVYNGKAVYRKCIAGTVPGVNGNFNVSMTVPMTGILLIIQAIIQRTDGYWFSVASPSANIEFSVSTAGVVGGYTNTGAVLNKPYIVWVEYTKS